MERSKTTPKAMSNVSFKLMTVIMKAMDFVNPHRLEQRVQTFGSVGVVVYRGFPTAALEKRRVRHLKLHLLAYSAATSKQPKPRCQKAVCRRR
jgi:hypothetical protein